MFEPMDLLATQVAPTAAKFLAEQLWRLHPNTPRYLPPRVPDMLTARLG
jgi:hypothetical protein